MLKTKEIEKRRIKVDSVAPGMFKDEKVVTLKGNTFFIMADQVYEDHVNVYILGVNGSEVLVAVPCKESPIPQFVVSLSELE
jgi:hypothetical protein